MHHVISAKSKPTTALPGQPIPYSLQNQEGLRTPMFRKHIDNHITT